MLLWKFRAELKNISEDVDMAEMAWDGTKSEKGVSWKLHNKSDPTFPQECVGKYVNTEKGTTISDTSSSGGLHVCSIKGEKTGTGTHILDWASLEMPKTKKIYSVFLKQ